MVIIYDTENENVGGPNAETNSLRVFAYYDTETGEKDVIRHTERARIQEVLSRDDPKIGFNNISYDNVILFRHGYRINGQILDLYEIVKKKSPVMKQKFKSYSLKNVCRVLGLDAKSDDIDYSWLNEEITILKNWTKIYKYTLQDIEITAQLWEYLTKYFASFADPELIDVADAKRYKHLNSSSGSYAYKVICRKAGLEERYNDNVEYQHYEGGFVSEPSTEFIKGKIYCMDYNSAYPFSYIQGNLFSNRCLCCTDDKNEKKQIPELKIDFYNKDKDNIKTFLVNKTSLKNLAGTFGDVKKKTLKGRQVSPRVEKFGKTYGVVLYGVGSS